MGGSFGKLPWSQWFFLTFFSAVSSQADKKARKTSGTRVGKSPFHGQHIYFALKCNPRNSGWNYNVARNCLACTLNYIVMQIGKVNSEKGYLLSAWNCLTSKLNCIIMWIGKINLEKGNSRYCSYQQRDTQTRWKSQLCIVLTFSPHLCAF